MKISRKMVSCLLVSSALVAAAINSSGEVLGADGGVYDGASPDQREALVLNSKRTGLFDFKGAKAGVSGSNIFVVVGEVCIWPNGGVSTCRSNALTFKKGQVLGSDGEVHDGASPEQQAALVEQSKQDGWFGKKKNSGVQGSNLLHRA